ncbi:MAG TPA: YaeQ family protein [Gammaproteobacteria bacterium]|nr:YaeQ family protein [Gammaproteobacteria bacterium]
MATNSTIFKAELVISDMDRNYYQTHTLTLARHPSETDERMMVRILVFALNADEHLSFTRGLSTEDEPDLWRKNYSDEIELWIDLGQPDEKRIKRACGRSQRVIIYCFSSRACDVWWGQMKNKVSRFKNLEIVKICDDVSRQLVDLTARTMRLQCTIQDGLIWLADESRSIEIHLEKLYGN